MNETGTVAIAGIEARMLTTTNFVGEVSASIGTNTNTFDVVATDLSGNKTTKWYQVPITANGLDTVLTYDATGNTLSKSNAAGMMTFGWDGANRCVAITNGIYRTALSYEGASRWARITEYSNSVVIADRRFIWNGVTLAEERDASNNVVQRFYSNGFQRGGTNYFYVKDHLGSVREVYSQSGVLQARFDYDPYGNKTQTYGTLKIDFGFAGLFELPNGMKLAVWRLYDPVTGRWGSKDPIKEDGGLNLYAYCGGDPVNSVDPSGLEKLLYIYSNVSKKVPNTDFADGHVALALYDTDSKQITTYALWPDWHPRIIKAHLNNGFYSDVRVNFPLDDIKSYKYRYSVKLTDTQVTKFKELVAENWQFRVPFQNCSSFASEAFERVTSIHVDPNDAFGIETPRQVGASIQQLQKTVK